MKKINILYIDNYELDRELVKDALEKEHGGFNVTEASNKKEFEAMLKTREFDVVLSDFNIAGFDGFQVLEAVSAYNPRIPVIIVTGTGSEEIAVKALKQGASDYVIKRSEHIRRLPKTVLAAIEKRTLKDQQQKAEADLKGSEEKFRFLYNNSPDMYVSVSPDDASILECNETLLKKTGYSRKEIIGAPIFKMYHDDCMDEVKKTFQQFAENGVIQDKEFILKKKDGGKIDVSLNINAIRDDSGKILYSISSWRDITKRVQAEAALREGEEKYRNILENIDYGYFEVDIAGNFIFFNDSMCKILGYPKDELLGMNNREYMDEENSKKIYQAFNKVYQTGISTKVLDWKLIRKDGSECFVETVVSMTTDSKDQGNGFRGIARDITDCKQLEAQLRQAQKMESVGRLAGGVAHDYNNALSVIIGYTEMAIDEVDPAGPLRDDLEEILAASKRAANITQQLLAFARKQTIAPTVLDLNDNVERMLKMLRRLIGEDIDLAWMPGAGLWPVKMDPTQIDQILANLCVNARDAIDGVGKVFIETENKTLDEKYCADHPGFVPGEFVLLSVSDNGCGIDKETLDNIFEPFFTTKEVGKGTGLGLATIYGIVKQNNGFVNAYSEPDKGTTFNIYLPRQGGGKADKIQKESTAQIPQGHGETVLVAEDDLPVLKLARQILEGLGYAVLTAGTTIEAMGLAEEHAGEISLLLTDVIMPEMNGRDLAQQLQALYPDLKRIFMSGYTADIIASRGVLDKRARFIQKPFSRRDLATIVRKALDGKE